MRPVTGCFAALALCSGLLAARPATAGMDLVTNGGFESGDFTGWTISGPQTSAPYILVSGPFMDAVQLNPYQGNYFAAVGFNGADGSISQTLATTAGAQYTLSFAYFAENGTPNDFSVAFGGNTVLSITNDTSNSTNPVTWTPYSFTVTATSNSTDLVISGRNDPLYSGVDSVSVTPNPTPEPSSLAVWGLGVVAALVVARRRRSA